jgi:hypothetical protein
LNFIDFSIFSLRNPAYQRETEPNFGFFDHSSVNLTKRGIELYLCRNQKKAPEGAF